MLKNITAEIASLALAMTTLSRHREERVLATDEAISAHMKIELAVVWFFIGCVKNRNGGDCFVTRQVGFLAMTVFVIKTG